MFRCKKANGEKFLRPLTIRCLFQNQASLANAFGAFFFGVPNYCNTLILTDIQRHTQFSVVFDELTFKYLHQHFLHVICVLYSRDVNVFSICVIVHAFIFSLLSVVL